MISPRWRLLVVTKVGIHVGSVTERSPRWANVVEAWIDIESGEMSAMLDGRIAGEMVRGSMMVFRAVCLRL